MSNSQAGDSNSGFEQFGTPNLVATEVAPLDDGMTDEGEERSFFVRALYDFHSNDASSLSFEKGTLIEVLTQLESGWWDGLLGNDVRGWFPSNYVERVSDEEAEAELQTQLDFEDLARPEHGSPRLSSGAMAAGSAIPAMRNGSRSTDDAQYAGLGLGHDFDALRDLMNGVPASDSADAFEQLAEATMTDSASRKPKSTPSQDDRLGVYDVRRRSRMSDQSSHVDSSLATNSTTHSNFSQTDISSMPPRSNAVSLSDADGHRKTAMMAADANNMSMPSRTESPDKERLRAHTVSGPDSQHASAQNLAGRPRAQTAHAGVPSTSSGISVANPNANATDIQTRSPPYKSRATRGTMQSKEEDSFWVPKVNERGEIFYFNTRTGQQARDLPNGVDFEAGTGAETPSSLQSDAEHEHEGLSSPNSTQKASTSRRQRSGLAASKDANRSRPSTSNSLQGSTTVAAHGISVDSMPDPSNVPWPWVVRTNEDEESYHLFNRQTQETSNDVNAILASTNTTRTLDPIRTTTRKLSDSTMRHGGSQSPRTRNGRTPSATQGENGMTSVRRDDEGEALSLQQSMPEEPMKSIRAMIDEAGDAIATLASMASEPIGSGGLSEEDEKALSSTGNSLKDGSRLSLAIADVVQAIRNLLQTSGALELPSFDLFTAAEAIQLVDGGTSGELAAAFATSLATLQNKLLSVEGREMDPFVTTAGINAIPATPASLLPLGKKINATLSKLVLSARSVVEQSCLNVETRPHFTDAQLEKIMSYRHRIKEDSMELARALGAFGNEAQRWRNTTSGLPPWARRTQGILKSCPGMAGIGLNVFGGGSAAGWRGHGFVLPTATETAALRAEAQGSYHNPFELTREAREALSSGKIALRRKPTVPLSRMVLESTLWQKFERANRSIADVAILIAESQRAGLQNKVAVTAVMETVQRALRQVGALIALIEELDLASVLDVDGPVVEGPRSERLEEYTHSVTKAREQLHAFIHLKQSTYDASTSLLMYLQDRSADSLARPEKQRMLTRIEDLTALLETLSSKIQQLRAVLVDLVNVSEFQGMEDMGFRGARAKVYGIDDVQLKMVGGKTDANDDVIYLGPGLAVPDGPTSAPNSAPPSANDAKAATAPPSSLKAMFQRGRSTSVATGASAASAESGSHSSMRTPGYDDADAAIAALRGMSKFRRDTADSVPSAATSAPDSVAVDQGDVLPGVVSTPKPVEETPWYLQPDTPPEDIVFNANGQVKGATLPALMERLTMHNAFDASFNTTFLMTYRSFTTTDELLDLLFARFRIKEPPGLTLEEHEQWVEKKQRPIRFRVFNVLKSWLESHFHEGENDAFVQRIKDFATDEMVHSPAMATPANLLLRIIERRSGKGEQMKITMVMPSSAPPPILPKNFRKIKFLDIDPLEMARQLTLMDSRLYNRIRPAECLGKAWSRENGIEIAKGVRDVISANNRVSGWVSEAILVQEDVKKRAAWVKQFVAIADRCYFLNNFSSMMAIYSGLNNASLNRLRRTWDAVNQRHLQLFENMRTLLAPTRNFTKYRETLRKLNPPCVPFLGVYLTDLTFIEDGNTDKLRNDDRLINISKRQMTAEKIQEIMIYQSTPYNLTPVPGIQKFIEENLIEARSDDELFEQSLRLEPREREDEKIARLLQESGFL